eukprot:GHVS01095778.1.p1 GENE.GHVS01095778.1~~GHVS01095778.1.p1  ORF type:complete len:137 (+),score=25.80 GHVS01095778.1:415-825(+)
MSSETHHRSLTDGSMSTKKKKRKKKHQDQEQQEQAEERNDDDDVIVVGKTKSKKIENASFRRVNESEWTDKIENEDLRDNSFWNKRDDEFAVKAASELGKVKGRDFRHEKSKKKRASWKGMGEIPTTVNSICLDSD